MNENHYIKCLQIRFYAELNDFLPRKKAHKTIDYVFKGSINVRDAVESLGVPHSSVDLVLVNSIPVPFTHRLKEGDYVSVYPVFETFDISEVNGKQKSPIRVTRFVVDAHLGKLTRHLRLLGFNSVYYSGIADDEIIRIAAHENRIILTRDRSLLKSSQVTHGYYIRATETHDQLREVIDKFDLTSQFKPFTLCLDCNHELVSIPVEEIKGEINEDTHHIFRNFFRCRGCKKIFWEGSHYESMTRFIRKISGDTGTGTGA
jgi:uncharacterized protein